MSKDQAARYNSNKTKLSMTFPLLTKLESMVSMFGAAKYQAYNWLKGGKATTPIDCMMRHLDALRAGEWLDPDSGLPHAAHIRWNAGQITQWYYAKPGQTTPPPSQSVLDWDLPVMEYTDQLAKDIEFAALKMEAAKEKYAAERKAAGLE